MENTVKQENNNPVTQVLEPGKQQVKGLKKFFPKGLPLRRLGLFILVIGMLVVIGFGVKSLMMGGTKLSQPVVQPLSGAKFIVLADKKNYKVGEDINITVRIATGGHTVDGADLLLKFDPEILETQDQDFDRDQVIFTEYPLLEYDDVDGIIRISGIKNYDEIGFNGVSEFALLKMRAIKEGSTNLSVEHKKDDTTDSNIIESETSNDILDQSYNLDLTIGPLVVDDNSKDQNSCQSYIQTCVDDYGKTGSQKCEAGKIDNNACMFDPLLTDFCEDCKVN